MAQITISGDTSGSITLVAPAVSGSTVLTLPTTSATLITDSSGVLNIGSGQAGRGTVDHVWRVFDENKEYLFKNLDIRVPTKSEKEIESEDWNIICEGELEIDRETSTAIITAVN